MRRKRDVPYSLIKVMNQDVKDFNFRNIKPDPYGDTYQKLMVEMEKIFDVWMDLDIEALDWMEKSFINIIKMCLAHQKNLPELAQKVYENKNDSRGSACWIRSGVMGQVLEVQAKIERILSRRFVKAEPFPDRMDEDTITDAWIDLLNYCRFGIVCCRYGRYTPIYSGVHYSGDIAYAQ
jgi:hypothetical protein